MDKKDKDDVTLPTKEIKEEETKKEEKNVDPPAEDVKEEPEVEPDPEPTLEDPPEEVKEMPEKPDLPELQEKLKLFRSHDAATLETKYANWTKEMHFLEDGSHAYIAERHIEDGGNGLIHLAIFYVD
jgi:hypothetical protein